MQADGFNKLFNGLLFKVIAPNQFPEQNFYFLNLTVALWADSGLGPRESWDSFSSWWSTLYIV